MDITSGALYLQVLLLLDVLSGFYAYRGKMLTVRQMRLSGVHRGLPFLWHSGMWGDVLIAIWAGYVVTMYRTQWSTLILFLLTIGILVVSMIISTYWRKQAEVDAVPEAHTTTLAGPLHVAYMAVVLPVIFMVYFKTRGVPHAFIILTSIGFWLHIFLAHHFIPALFGSEWYPRRPWRMKSFYVTMFVLTALLTGASWWCISRS